jgi:hypothetical protein
MAKIIWSGLVNELRGKLGGVVFSKSKQGNYVKRLSICVDRKSDIQLEQRGLNSILSQNWRLLDSSSQLLWINLALQCPLTDSLGHTYYLSGFQIYMRLNRNLQACNSATITTPLGINQNIISPFLSFSFDIITSPGSEDMKFNFSEAIPADQKVIIESTGPTSLGIYYPTNFKKFTVLDSTFITGASVMTDYVNKFGSFPITGDKVWFRYWKVGCFSGFLCGKNFTYAIGTV